MRISKTAADETSIGQLRNRAESPCHLRGYGRGFRSRQDASSHSTSDSSCNVCGHNPSRRRRVIVLTTMLSTDDRITTAHRAKLAYVYVRQSSPGQVRHHQESAELQYRLVERSALFGVG